VLHLGENQLSGSIPPALGELASLEMLTLYRNRLTDSSDRLDPPGAWWPRLPVAPAP